MTTQLPNPDLPPLPDVNTVNESAGVVLAKNQTPEPEQEV